LVQHGSRLRAHQNLPCRGRRFHLDRASYCRAGDHKLPVEPTDQEEVEATGMDAHRHPERHRAGRGADPADGTHRPLHLRSRPARSCRVVIALEQQEDGVTAPFHETGSVGVRHGE
jgi:hypothetical protein